MCMYFKDSVQGRPKYTTGKNLKCHWMCLNSAQCMPANTVI